MLQVASGEASKAVWLDAEVLSADESAWSGKHTLKRIDSEGVASSGDGTFEMQLVPLNHAPREMPSASFEGMRQRYYRTLRAQHASIIDALSGRRLDVKDHCVPIAIQQTSVAEDSHLGAPAAAAQQELRDSVKDVETLCVYLHKMQEQRVHESQLPGKVVRSQSVLLTAGPAAGKTCLISQMIIHSIDAQTELVPVMIRVQDLQKRLLAKEESVVDLFRTSWNWIGATHATHRAPPKSSSC